MEEAVKVYIPNTKNIPDVRKEVEEKLNSWNDIMADQKTKPQHRESNYSETRMGTLKRVLVEREANVHVLEEKHPWVAPTYKGLLALLLAFLLQFYHQMVLHRPLKFHQFRG